MAMKKTINKDKINLPSYSGEQRPNHPRQPGKPQKVKVAPFFQ